MSRLLAGSLGTLGLILEVSVKVLPLPVAQATLRFQLPQDQALDKMNHWAGRPLPITATAWEGQRLMVRLAGAEAAVRDACGTLGGERVPDGEAADHWGPCGTSGFLSSRGRAPMAPSLPSTAPLDLPGDSLIEWGGAQRWLRGDPDPAPCAKGRAGPLAMPPCSGAVSGLGRLHAPAGAPGRDPSAPEGRLRSAWRLQPRAPAPGSLMETHLADFIKGTRAGQEAEAILRACVHCGFCTATCPTYQVLGDELDGPRGRIYLIKSVLEGEEPTAKTQCTWTAA